MKKYLLKFLLFLLLSFILYSCPESSSDSSGGSSGGGSSDNNEEQTTPPAAPSDLTLSAASFCRIIVNWNDNSNNESEFVIERSRQSDFSTLEREIHTNANISTYSDIDGLISETIYYYRIKASNGVGDSSYSNDDNVTTLSMPTPINSRIIDHNCINLDLVPATQINNAKNTLHIAYEHTSHGNQIIVGMNGLDAFKGGTDLYVWNDGPLAGHLDLDNDFASGDLGNPDRVTWEALTRTYLNNPANSDVNVVIWSWCGQVSSANEADINTYLNLMAQLEIDYPGVTFVYMTGHLDGSGLTGNLHLRNEQIREYCRNNNKWLFDFEDIESFNPDGVYFGDQLPDDNCDYDSDGTAPRTETGNWAIEWQNAHPGEWYNCSPDHTQALNGNLKAYAAW